jgi:hypothetical protein
MFENIFILMLLNFWVSFYTGYGINYTISQSKRLTQHLMIQHERNAPPEDRVILTLDIDLVNIISVNEVKKRMTLQVFMYEEWFDSTLVWEPHNFGGTPAEVIYTGKVIRSHPALYSIACDIKVEKFPLDTQKCQLDVFFLIYF